LANLDVILLGLTLDDNFFELNNLVFGIVFTLSGMRSGACMLSRGAILPVATLGWDLDDDFFELNNLVFGIVFTLCSIRSGIDVPTCCLASSIAPIEW